MKMDWKIRQEKRKKISPCIGLYGVSTLLLVIGLIMTLNTANANLKTNLYTGIDHQGKSLKLNNLPTNQETDLKSKIRNMASIHGIDARKALAIADCESKTGKYLFNFEGGSAKGIFQFTDKTWNAYCEGNVLNTDDNLNCFMDLYNSFPSWWKCSNYLAKN